MPQAKVEIIQGAPPRVVLVPPGGLVIGRGETATLRLETASVSKTHARLSWEGDDLIIEDLGSRNRVLRDGFRLEAPTLVGDGDEFVLGDVVLRVSLAADGFGYPVTTLTDTTEILAPKPEESRPTSADSIERRTAELLPVVETFFHARDGRELGKKIVQAAKAHLAASRVALLEIEEHSRRYRVLGLEGATDPSFASRSIINDALRRGIALHQLGAVGRAAAGSILNARATSAMAVALRTRGERARVLYLDTLPEDVPRIMPLGWRNAFEVQLFAASAASAFEALHAQKEYADEKLRFESLRRHFSPSIVDQLRVLMKDSGELVRPSIVNATVVFADLAGFTRLTDRWRAHPDSLAAILDLWFEAGTRAVFAHRGTLDKYIGDAIMAVFGAPFAVPDAALLAVRCALDMQAAIAELTAQTGEPLSLSIGICTGPVLAAAVGSKRRRELTVLGDTVARAARLRETAGSGTILASDETAQAVGEAVELEPLGEMSLVGSAARMPVWRVLGLRGVMATMPPA